MADSETLSVGGDQLVFRSTSAAAKGAPVACDVRIPAGGGPPALHRHDPFELYRVEQGELAFYVADDDGEVERSVRGAGAVVAIPGGREHTVRNESDRDAEAYVVFSPGAPMEAFIRAAAALRAPAMDDVLRLADEHGVEITRPLAG